MRAVTVFEQQAPPFALFPGKALALQRERTAEHRHASALFTLIEAHRTAQVTAARELAQERGRRERAEAAERALRQTLAFKDVAIQEVHHRIKNTIQIAASVLSLQARATASTEVRTALLEGYARLHLLAKVHELLYTGTERTEEILMPTLLDAMADGLRQSFAELSGRVRLTVISDQIVLATDDAIAMALLANEAITNACKYAFADGSTGEIAITLRCDPTNALILQITDNGVGIRPGGNPGGLGLKLMRSFAAQLQGTLDLRKPTDAEGTAVILTIHRDAQRALRLSYADAGNRSAISGAAAGPTLS